MQNQSHELRVLSCFLRKSTKYLKKTHHNASNVNNRQPAIIVSNLKMFATAYSYEKHGYRILQQSLWLDSCIIISLLHQIFQNHQSGWKSLIINKDLHTKAILYVQCVMIRLLILHATPFAVCSGNFLRVLTTVWQTAPTKILSGHDRGLKTLPNQNRSQAVPICDPHIQKKTRLCIISSQSSSSIINKTANKASHWVSFI